MNNLNVYSFQVSNCTFEWHRLYTYWFVNTFMMCSDASLNATRSCITIQHNTVQYSMEHNEHWFNDWCFGALELILLVLFSPHCSTVRCCYLFICFCVYLLTITHCVCIHFGRLDKFREVKWVSIEHVKLGDNTKTSVYNFFFFFLFINIIF